MIISPCIFCVAQWAGGCPARPPPPTRGPCRSWMTPSSSSGCPQPPPGRTWGTPDRTWTRWRNRWRIININTRSIFDEHLMFPGEGYDPESARNSTAEPQTRRGLEQASDQLQPSGPQIINCPVEKFQSIKLSILSSILNYEWAKIDTFTAHGAQSEATKQWHQRGRRSEMPGTDLQPVCPNKCFKN